MSKGLTTAKKAVIISMLSVVALLLVVLACVITFNPNIIRKNNSRTIMIFMAGTNLESNGMLASSDLEKIVPSTVDLDNNKVLLYTGGTKKWYNFVDPKEEAIYELTSNGFVKLKSFTKSNLGYDTALANFLNYSYDYSKTDKYDLIFWDHGLGAIGSISDENTGDYLDLTEIKSAFEKSPFKNDNKLETITFRTCLNATLEVAGTIYPYADYMVASEEVTIGKKGHGVLGFINEIKPSYTAEDYGKSFIASYQKQVDEIDFFGQTSSTYSIVDLSKIPELITLVDNFFGKIDANDKYREISRIRANLYQYGNDTSNVSDYDTVDLYELVDKLRKYNEDDGSKLSDFIRKEVVVYNWSVNDHSNGLSIYFPYSGGSYSKKVHLDLYDKINVSPNYKKFINTFSNNTTSSAYSFNYDLSQNTITQKGNEFKLKLNEDQIKNFAKASYIVFKKESDGLFMPIYVGNDATLDKNGYVSTNISNNILYIVDEIDNSKSLFTYWQIESSSDKYTEYTVPLILNRINDEGWPVVENANMHIKIDKKNKVHIDEVYLLDKDTEGLSKTTGTLVDLKDYSSIDFSNLRYKVLDDNGNYTTEWGRNGTLYFWEVKDNKFHFEVSSLDKSGDYYCVFAIKDTQNNVNYSNLINIGKEE